MVDLWQLSMPIAGVKLVATRGRKKILNGVAAQLQLLQKGENSVKVYIRNLNVFADLQPSKRQPSAVG